MRARWQPCPAFRHCCHQIAAATSWRAHFYISQCDNCRAICQSIAMALYGVILCMGGRLTQHAAINQLAVKKFVALCVCPFVLRAAAVNSLSFAFLTHLFIRRTFVRTVMMLHHIIEFHDWLINGAQRNIKTQIPVTLFIGFIELWAEGIKSMNFSGI